MVDRAAGEPNPEGVVEGVGPLQAFDQLFGILEIEGMSLHPVSKWADGGRVAGERAHRYSVVEEALRDVLSGVSEGSGYD